MSLKRCQREVDSAEFVAWQAYSLLDPFGAERADWRAGMVAATIANVNRGRTTRPYHPRDFMPSFRPRPPEPVQTVEEQQQILGLVALASGGTISGADAGPGGSSHQTAP